MSSLDQITLGPDGTLWFTQPNDDQIGRMAIPSGVVLAEYNVPGADNEPEGITVGPDGAIWFTAAGVDKIGRIPVPPLATSTGGITWVPASGTAGIGVGDITAGPDGALWFTEGDGNRIGRMKPGDPINHYPAFRRASQRALGHHRRARTGALWFAESLKRSDRPDHDGRVPSPSTPVQAPTHPRWRSARTGRSGSPNRISARE